MYALFTYNKTYQMCVCAWLRSSNTPPGCLRIPDPLTLTSESTLHSSLRQLSAAENSRDILLVVRARRDRFRWAHKVEESVIQFIGKLTAPKKPRAHVHTPEPIHEHLARIPQHDTHDNTPYRFGFRACRMATPTGYYKAEINKTEWEVPQRYQMLTPVGSGAYGQVW